MAPSANMFVWYELATTDVDGAKAFYAAVVGWEAQDFQEEPRYVVMSTAGKMVAGVTSLCSEAPGAGRRPGWLGYVSVDDVNAATEGVRAAGGGVHQSPADIPGVGRFSVVADPQGAVFMLFRPLGADAVAPPAGTSGLVGWHELHAQHWPGALDFYARQFGWTQADAVDMGPMGIYQIFAVGGEPLGGMMNRAAASPSPFWLFYFTVAGADAAAARVLEHGGQIASGPHQVPGGRWILQCVDPQGAMFALVSGER